MTVTLLPSRPSLATRPSILASSLHGSLESLPVPMTMIHTRGSNHLAAPACLPPPPLTGQWLPTSALLTRSPLLSASLLPGLLPAVLPWEALLSQEGALKSHLIWDFNANPRGRDFCIPVSPPASCLSLTLWASVSLSIRWTK